ncbi:MAG: hypothetical protein ACI90V_007930, partial [Bacillariaceae sp.]
SMLASKVENKTKSIFAFKLSSCSTQIINE